MVTQAYHFHATPEVASKLTLGVTDTQEIKKSAWYEVTTIDKMYASHKDWLDKMHNDYKSNKQKEATLTHSPCPSILPCKARKQWPETRTALVVLSSRSRHTRTLLRTKPPLRLAWRQQSVSSGPLPRRSDQYGLRIAWTEPVAASSSMPSFGRKTRAV